MIGKDVQVEPGTISSGQLGLVVVFGTPTFPNIAP
jgi:hypothetical protein